VHLGYVALVLTLAALGLAWVQWQPFLDPKQPYRQVDLFQGMLVFDALSVFMKLLLLAGTALVIWQTLLTGIPDQEDSADFYCLLLGASVGMMLMTSANHLLMVFIAVEMASLPSYALAGFLKGRRQSSEAALKYVVFGGAAAGVMLYGISLFVGRFGTGYLPEVAAGFQTVLSQGGMDGLLLAGLLLILVGLAFKLSAVPFHFWCPDVFEGAAAEVAGYLSVVSKAAAVALTGRFMFALAGLTGAVAPTPEEWKLSAGYLGPALVFLAAITATYGNLAAYAQTNLKRLLAYSTIAHAGIVLMGVACLTRSGLAAALFYMTVYMLMNLGAFGVVAFLRNQVGSEDLSAMGGMIRRAPIQVICLAIFFLSLVGMPPLVGYIAKFEVFAALYDTSVTEGSRPLLILLVIGLANTVISLFFYVKVLKTMIIDPAPHEDAAPLRGPPQQNRY
jgi:NADH-quinone oxidoreductase subunit N